MAATSSDDGECMCGHSRSDHTVAVSGGSGCSLCPTCDQWEPCGRGAREYLPRAWSCRGPTYRPARRRE